MFWGLSELIMTLIYWRDAVAETQHVLLGAVATAQRSGHWKKTTVHFIKVSWIIVHVENKNLKVICFLGHMKSQLCLHYSYSLIPFIMTESY